MDAAGQGDAAEGRVGVGGRGRGDVVALGVEDGEQAETAGLAQQPLHHGHAVGAARLEEGALRLDDRRDRGDDVKHAAAKLLVSGGHRTQRIIAVARPYFERQGLPARVEADAQGVALGANGVGESVGKMLHGNGAGYSRAFFSSFPRSTCAAISSSISRGVRPRQKWSLPIA